MPASTFSGETPAVVPEAGEQQHSLECSGDWYALRVKPRHEKRVAETLRLLGYEPFLPLYQTRRRWSDRYKTISVPLFSCYAFCRFSSGEQALPVQVPGVRGVVGVGKTPRPVENREIEAIRKIVGAGLPAAPWPSLQAGDRVRVLRGPLSGLEGVLHSTRGTDRLVITVSLLQRSVAVEIERDWVMVLRSAGRAKPEFYQGRLRRRIAALPGHGACNKTERKRQTASLL